MVTVSLDPDREIYPNPTLNLVACELSFFAPLPVELASIQAALYKTLQRRFPLPGPAPQQLAVEFAGEGQPTARRLPGGFRFMNRRRSESVVITPRSLVVETSAYDRFERFSELTLFAADAVARATPIPGLGRAGLRYIDEISEADLPELKWTTYIEPALLNVLGHFAGDGPSQFTTAVTFPMEPGYELLLRYGLLDNPVVDARGPLIIRNSPVGRFFLIDIDSSWQSSSEEEIPAFSRDDVARTLESLHGPVRTIFEQTITDNLRNDVLRKESLK
jgi:uncharacterized protein (TIGR04255 family)